MASSRANGSLRISPPGSSLAKTTRSPGPKSERMKRGTKSSYLGWTGMRMSCFVFGLRAYVRRNRMRTE